DSLSLPLPDALPITCHRVRSISVCHHFDKHRTIPINGTLSSMFCYCIYCKNVHSIDLNTFNPSGYCFLCQCFSSCLFFDWNRDWKAVVLHDKHHICSVTARKIQPFIKISLRCSPITCICDGYCFFTTLFHP